MNLSTKIIFSILGVLLLLMGGITYLITSWQRSAMIQSTHHYCRVLGETISDSIAMEMSLGRSDLVQGTLERIGEGSPQIRGLRIFDPRGRILRSVNPAEIGQHVNLSAVKNHLKDVPALFEHRREEEPLLSFGKPFPNRSQCQRCHEAKEKMIGFLVLDVSNKPVAELVLSTQKFVLGGMAVTFFVVAGAVLFITVRWVRRPLATVTDAMKKVEEGDLDTKVHLHSRDELARVARSFNSMVERLKKNKDDLETFHQREHERTQRMATLGEMAQTVAHEIRNPIAGVSAAVKIIREGLGKDDPQARVFDEIHFQTDRIAKIVSNLLQFARHSAPRFFLIDIHEIVERTLILFSFQFEDQRIQVDKEFQTDLPRIYADPDHIQEVLMNIILNAIHAMPEGGRLLFRTASRPDGEMASLTIADTGKGIPGNTLEKVFKPFYTTKTRGAGLGLAIVEKIVREHGGKVAIFSEVDVGTRVEISLPLRPSTPVEPRS